MTEQKIEQKVKDAIAAKLQLSGVQNVQIIGAWDVTDGLKAVQLEDSAGVIVVKAQPRQYETPTIPDGQVDVTVALTVRADIDSCGQVFFKAADAIQDILKTWQSSQQAYCSYFTIQNELVPTGFQMSGGDIGLDQDAKLFQYQQSFQFYGVFA